MLDFDLQVRFWRGVTDAMMHNTEAAIAAASEWQDQMLRADKGKPSLANAASPAFGFGVWPWTTASSTSQASMWWLGPWQQFASPWTGQSSPSSAAPRAGFNCMTPFASMSPMFDMTPWFNMWFSQSLSAWSPQAKSASPWGTAWSPAWGFGTQPATSNPFAAFWPFQMLPFSYMQMPLTAMLMSAGMPYKVASPSAKASTSAMDAAEAARQQMEKVYSAYRSDGGHAAAQIITLPWSIAASFLDPDAKPRKTYN
ncbi:MAG: hypothetical protein ABL897_00720 [Hyphomicrobium sp.]